MALFGIKTIKCPHCHRDVRADANFCPYCGNPLKSDPRPRIEDARWARRPEDFATRVDVHDVPSYFRKDVIVEPGTQAILLVDGRNEAGTVGPGRYTLQTLRERMPLIGRARSVVAILVDVGATALEFTVTRLFTRDPLEIALDVRLGVQVAQPVAFLVNFMKGRRSVTLQELRQYLYPEIQNAAAEFIGRYSVQDLGTNLNLKEELAMHVEAHLMETFREMGLRFDRVRAMNFRHEQWDEIQKTKAQYFLQIGKEEAELEGRKRLLDVFDQKALLEIAEETRKVTHYEQKAQLWARMRQAVLQNRMDEIRSEEDFARFMRQISRQRLLEENELEELKRELLERKEDHERQRAFLLAKAELEQQYALKMLELSQRRDLSLQELELEQEIARKRLEGELAIEEKRWAWELKRRREEAEFRRAQEEAERKAKLEAMRDEALTRAEIDDLERRSIQEDLELGLGALRKMKAINREDLEEQLRIRWEDEKRRLEMELQRQRQQLELELQRYRLEKEMEIQRLQVLATMSAEALIAASDAERGKIIAELKRTEAMANMSEEQILAMVAERSPEVAKAFQERFRSLSNEEIKALYERLVAAEQKSKEEQQRITQDTLARMERMFEKALDSQRESTTAFARDRGGQPIIVTPGTGGTTVVGGPGVMGSVSGRVQVCPNCKVEVPVGTKYCPNCGFQFYE